MRILLLPLSLALSTGNLSAQDTLKKTDTIQKRYPVLRLLTIQKEYFGNSDYRIRVKSGDLQQEGEASSERLQLSATVPVYSKNKLTLLASVNYTRENITTFNKTSSELYNKSTKNINDFDAAFSAIYKGMLFNRPIITRASLVFGSTNIVGVKKISGSFSSSLIIKATPKTITTFGAVVSLDQSSLVPLFPLFSYWHKFSNSLWELDAVLPQKIIVRRSEVLNGWLNAGVELNGNSFFVKQDAQMQFRAGNYELVSSDIYTNIGYEHMLGKKLLLGAKGGYRNSLTTRLVKVNDPISDYKYRTKISAPFFSMNVSFVIN